MEYIHVGSVLFTLFAWLHGCSGSSSPEQNHTANPNCRLTEMRFVFCFSAF